LHGKDPNLLQEGVPDPGSCWSLLERVAESGRLARAARLRDLLLFVGRRSLKEGCEQIREYDIGVEVFGRPAGYDTNVDNIVRASVSELRKRIEAYFASEGAHEKLIMEIPRGSYIPTFRNHTAEPQGSTEPVDTVVPPFPELPNAIPSVQGPAKRRQWVLAESLLCGVILLALASSCVALWLQNRSLQRSLYPWKYEPGLKAFWPAFLDSPLDTDIVLPDASFGQFQILTKDTFPLQDYISRNYINRMRAENQNPNVQLALSVFATNSFVTPSSIKLSDSILALDPHNRKMHLYFSDEYRPSLLGEDNIILLGVPLANPWMGLYENRLNFTLSTLDLSYNTITNRAPAPGEKASYVRTDSDTYCAIAYLPNTAHNGKILIIQGTNPDAFEAARFFLLSEDQLSNFQNMLHVTKFPYFEVVLKVTRIGETPLNATVVAYRAYPNLP
jgi:hypothetical protein